MYASKRRQRNFKRIRENKQAVGTTNPSKRHRERLNGELETIASLLPYETSIITRLDKLSVLRLAVSYLQIKAHFQTTFLHPTLSNTLWLPYSHLWNPHQAVGRIPTLIDPVTRTVVPDINEFNFDSIAGKALGGFLLILNEHGDINYASENIEHYLGFHQSDILHQPIFEMIHSEDREDVKSQLSYALKSIPNITSAFDLLHIEDGKYLERSVSARFRCLLDNTCGFCRVDIKGYLTPLFGPHMQLQSTHVSAESIRLNTFGLIAVCCPFVQPLHMDMPISEDPILKSKHALDLSFIQMDSRMRAILEIDEESCMPSFYQMVYPDDEGAIVEAHSEVAKTSTSGILVYRMVGQKSGLIYWFQSSCRMFFKNGKPENIGLTHRLLTEVEGTSMLEKRGNLKSKLLSFDESLIQSPKAMITSTITSSITTMGNKKSDSQKQQQKVSHPINISNNALSKDLSFYSQSKIDFPSTSFNQNYPITPTLASSYAITPSLTSSYAITPSLSTSSYPIPSPYQGYTPYPFTPTPSQFNAEYNSLYHSSSHVQNLLPFNNDVYAAPMNSVNSNSMNSINSSWNFGYQTPDFRNKTTNFLSPSPWFLCDNDKY